MANGKKVDKLLITTYIKTKNMYKEKEPYNYEESVYQDIENYLSENKERLADKTTPQIYEEVSLADSVTGQGSESYYCNIYKAEQSLNWNYDTIYEVLSYFSKSLPDSPETMDMLIRMYYVNKYFGLLVSGIELPTNAE